MRVGQRLLHGEAIATTARCDEQTHVKRFLAASAGAGAAVVAAGAGAGVGWGAGAGAAEGAGACACAAVAWAVVSATPPVSLAFFTAATKSFCQASKSRSMLRSWERSGSGKGMGVRRVEGEGEGEDVGQEGLHQPSVALFPSRGGEDHELAICCRRPPRARRCGWRRAR